MDPELAAVVPLLPKATLADVAAAREMFDAGRAAAPPVDFGPVQVSERRIPRRDGSGELTLRILAEPGGSDDRPGVLDIHGGGMVIGTPAMDDALNVAIVREVGAVVVSVDYRLAPEHPFPAGLDDCYTAMVWFAQNAAELGVDSARIAIVGDSGGGNLAAATALRARDAGDPSLAFQVLVEPVLDDRLDSHSMTVIGQDSVLWDRANAALSWQHYLGGQAPSTYAAPARAEDLSGLPPTYITVNELDPLRDEGMQYAQRLLAAGVATELHVWPQAFHGFASVAPSAVSRRANEALIGALQRGLAAAAPSEPRLVSG